ncbi:MAG: SLC13 family permease [Pseudomonadota bacterium]
MEMAIVVALLAGVLLCFIRGGPAPELVALAAFAALPALGILALPDVISVFSSQAPLTIALMFVMSAALERTGCVAVLGSHVSRLARGSYPRALALLMGAAMLCSAAMNNTPVVIIMIPLALSLAASVGVSPGRLLMPLSFAAIFGGSATLIGASANVLVSDGAAAHGAEPFGMFEMTAPALVFAAAGWLYMMGPARLLLPDREPVRPRSAKAAPPPGISAASRVLPEATDVSGQSIRRSPVAPGPGVSVDPASSDGSAAGASPKTAVWGCDGDYRREKAPLAIAIVLGVMLAAAFGLAPIVVLAGAGAALAVALGCVTLSQAARAVDWRLIAMIFGMLGLSLGLEKTGAVALFADALTGAGGGGSPALALLLLYASTSVLTAVITNNAVALMMVPVALALAAQLGVDPRAFLMAVMFAASASFATPIGYQTNTIVYRAGGYRFHDFLLVGLPLNILFGAVATLILPLFFPF